MYHLIIALVLLVFTGLLTVTGYTSSLPTGVYPLAFTLIACSYCCFVEYKSRMSKTHNRYKRIRMPKSTHAKPAYRNDSVPAIFLAGGDKSSGPPPEPIFVTRPKPKPKSKAPANASRASALRSHIGGYSKFLYSPASYDVLALVFLLYSVYRGSLLAFQSVVHELTGLGLLLRSACTRTNLGYLAIMISVSVYSLRKYLLKLSTIKHTASIPSALREVHPSKLDDSPAFDDTFQSPATARPQPQPHSEPKPEPAQLNTPVPKASRPAVSRRSIFPDFDPQKKTQAELKAEVDASIARAYKALRVKKEGEAARRRYYESRYNSVRTSRIRQERQPSHVEDPVDSPNQDVEPPSASPNASAPHSLPPELDSDYGTSDDSSSANTSANEQPEPSAYIPIVLPPIDSPQANSLRGPVREPTTPAQVKVSPMSAPKCVVAAQIATGDGKSVAVLHRSQWKTKQKWLVVAKKDAQLNTKKAKELGPMDITEQEPSDAAVEPMDTAEEEANDSVMDSPKLSSDGTFSPMVLSPTPAQVSSFGPQSVDTPMDTDEGLPGARFIRGLPRRTAARPSRTDAPSTSNASAPTPMEIQSGPVLPPHSIPQDAVMESPKAPNAGFHPMTWSPVPPSSSSRVSSSVLLDADTPMDPVEQPSEVRKFKPLPRRAAPPSSGLNVPSTSRVTPPAPKTPTPGRTLPPHAGPIAPTGNMGRFQMFGRFKAIPAAAMRPRDLAAAMSEGTNKSTEAPKVRVAPVFMLSNKERTVVQKGEYIPPNTQYLVKDQRGTVLRVTGPRGLRV